MQLTPRDYQIESVNSVFKFFATHKEGNPIIGLPTGTGKGFVLALLLEKILKQFPRQRLLVATHVKELISQDADELLGLWPDAPLGVYSSGLKRKELYNPITVGGIQSLIKVVEELGHIDLMFVDECHLISLEDESTYNRLITVLKIKNPHFRVVGLTATPWRQGQGRLTDGGGIFTHMCIDLTDMRSFNRFIRESYLKPLISGKTSFTLDVSKVHKKMGEYDQKELQEAVNKDDITYAALKESITVALEENRNHWLVFASGIDHAIRVTEMLIQMGISARCVHSKMPEAQRDLNIKEWKEGKFTAMVNNGILTTGINFKEIDLIIMLRPTHSTVLWVQMLGRGTRAVYALGFDITTLLGRQQAIAASGIPNCRVMDFAGNCMRLGPINDPVIPPKRGEPTGEVPVKICDICGTYNHISAKFCGGVSKLNPDFNKSEGCGEEFHFRVLLKETAADVEVIRTEEPIVQVFEVDHITVKRNQKAGKPPGIMITYCCGPRRFNEFVLPEHPGGPARKARDWWAARSVTEMPATTQEMLTKIEHIAVPSHVRVWVNAPYPKVLAISFTGAFEKPIIGDEIPF